MKIEVEIPDEAVVGAALHAYSQRILRGALDEHIRVRVKRALEAILRDDENMNAMIEGRVRVALDGRVKAIINEAIYRAALKTEEEMANKAWCKTHGLVDIAVGCATCQREGEK